VKILMIAALFWWCLVAAEPDSILRWVAAVAFTVSAGLAALARLNRRFNS
jgi:hypothetical protein